MKINEAFFTGEAFHKAANSMIPDDWIEDESDGYWFIPSIVNLSLACELYLKYLLCENGIDYPRTHDLKTLFLALPLEIQNKVLNSAEFRGDDEFYNILEEDKDVFKKWRYYFENSSISVELIFLGNFAYVLHSISEQILDRDTN